MDYSSLIPMKQPSSHSMYINAFLNKKGCGPQLTSFAGNLNNKTIGKREYNIH